MRLPAAPWLCEPLAGPPIPETTEQILHDAKEDMVETPAGTRGGSDTLAPASFRQSNYASASQAYANSNLKSVE